MTPEQIAEESRKQCESELGQRFRRRVDLWHALQNRVLTVEELAEIESIGPDICVRYYPFGDGGWLSDCFKQEDIEKRFQQAILHQFRLRLALEEHNASLADRMKKEREEVLQKIEEIKNRVTKPFLPKKKRGAK
jgi:hypothetical protein